MSGRYKEFGTGKFRNTVKVEAALLKGARRWLNINGYTEVVVPHIVNATGSCEVIDTLFELPYFGRKAYLTQTGQLYLEALVPFFGGKVWTFGSSFRAEPKADDRHLTEFSLLELEFEGDFEKMLRIVEQIFLEMLDEVRSVCYVDIPQKCGRIRYEEAIGRLGLTWGMDIRAPDEQKLSADFGCQPFFITHFPKELKYFNMRVSDEDPRVVNSADFILPKSGESAGCAEREYKPIRLRQRLLESSMWKNFIARGGDRRAFDWYLKAYEAHAYKLHSGFGMGLNRITKFVLGTDDIRDTTAYPTNAETIY
jgi:asparaginyl-tRNA synthetase